MPNVPLKQLQDNEEDFFPMVGPSSYSGVMPISKGGTGATTPAAARTALGITAPTPLNLVFGADTALTVTAPSGFNLIGSTLKAQVTADGKYFRISGHVSAYRQLQDASVGYKSLSVTGITITAPSTEKFLKTCGFRQHADSNGKDTIDMEQYDDPSIIVDTSGNISLRIYNGKRIAGVADYDVWKFIPFIVCLS